MRSDKKTHLPVEIYALIVSHLANEPAAICALSLTSRTLYTIARKHPYRVLGSYYHYHPSTHSSGSTSSTQIQPRRTLDSLPLWIGQTVRGLTIVGDVQGTSTGPTSNNTHNLWENRRLTQIHTLTLRRLYPPLPMIPFPTTLQHLTLEYIRFQNAQELIRALPGWLRKLELVECSMPENADEGVAAAPTVVAQSTASGRASASSSSSLAVASALSDRPILTSLSISATSDGTGPRIISALSRPGRLDLRELRELRVTVALTEADCVDPILRNTTKPLKLDLGRSHGAYARVYVVDDGVKI